VLFSETLIARRKSSFAGRVQPVRIFVIFKLPIYRYAGIAPSNGVRGKLVILQLVQKFTAFCIIQRFRYRIHKMLSPVQIFGHVLQSTPIRLLQMCFSIFSYISRSSKWCRSLWFPHQIMYTFVVSVMRAACSSHLVLGFITLIVFDEDYKP